MQAYTESPVERVFAEYGNRATAADYRAAAAETLRYRQAAVARAAETLRHARVSLRESSAGVRPELRAMCSRWLRERFGRLGRAEQIPRATVAGMRRELAALRGAIAWAESPEARRRLEWAPCGLQDAAESRRWADQQMARLLPIMIRLAAR
jgi:hypothetical protein